MLTIDNPMPRLCEDTVEISAVDFAKYADQYIEIWSKLEGARIHHSKLGDGKILRVEHRKDYIPLIYLIFDNENEKIFNSESFKVGNVTAINIPKKLHSLIITDIEKLWRNIDINLASWLNQVTIAIVGQDHTDQLKQERNELIINRQDAIERERRIRLERAELERNKRLEDAELERKIRQDEVEYIQQKERLEKGKYDRIIKKIYADHIRNYVIDRQIQHLMHFTPLYNLPSILKYGLQSRNRLLNHNVIFPDESRADGWLDWISLSISFPNYKMFYDKRKSMPIVNGWAVLLIRSDVLWELNCKFILTNAASSQIRMFEDSKWSSIDELKRMFSYEEYRINIPINYTTDPQAEVMVNNEIPINYIVNIAVKDTFDASQFAYLKDNLLIVCPELFKPRIDWIHWQQRRLSLFS